ncbi:MAG: efflux transporter outer membrane subunit, partial [Pseudomonadota bacterium]
MQLTKKTIIISLCSILFSCAIGKDYKRPEVAKIEAFKESKDWKIAKPKENEIKSKWWEVYNDPELNKLEEQVEISNQNIKAAEAAYRQARAVVSENRAAYFPSITGNAATNRNAVANNVVNKYSVNLDAAWEIDVWGRIRRSVESSFALSKASQADLAAAKLSAQSELAINYFSLKIADKQKFLLEDTVKNYQKSLQLNENLYKSGVAPKSDLLQAKTQLETAMAQSIDIDNTRAKLEHAIALLIGKAPAELSLVVSDKIPEIPEIPLGLPSELLERRPDVAAAEQRMI